jgi:hypothetical protein
MEIIEAIAWITLGFVPMLGSMELAWRLNIRKRSATSKFKDIRGTSLIDLNRRLTELLPSSEFERLWLRDV